MQNKKIVHQNLVPKKILIVTGLMRSGKGLACPIISSLNNCEKFNLNYTLEKLLYLRFEKKISSEIFSYFFNSEVNQDSYNLKIGRQVNFRYSDFTSIWKNKNPSIFFKRMRKKEGENIFREILKSKNYFIYMMHNALIYSDLIFSQNKEIKFINIVRNPIDIVHSWMKKKYGNDYYDSPRLQSVNYKISNKYYPELTIKNYKYYEKLPSLDRIVYWIDKLINLHKKQYEKLTKRQKKNILFVDHQNLATNTNEELAKICKFLKKTKSKQTNEILLKERCFRKVENFTTERFEKREVLFKLLSKKYKNKLKKLEKTYTKF